MRLIDPRNEVAAVPAAAPPRLTTLAGKTVALLDISKPGGSVFLDRLERLLTERGASRVVRAMKPTFTKPAPDPIIEQLRSADAVVLALAD